MAKIYKAEIRCGRVKVMSAEVISDAGNDWQINPKNEIHYYMTKLAKRDVYETAQLAVEALKDRLRRNIDHALKEAKGCVRDLEQCHAWKETE